MVMDGVVQEGIDHQMEGAPDQIQEDIDEEDEMEGEDDEQAEGEEVAEAGEEDDEVAAYAQFD